MNTRMKVLLLVLNCSFPASVSPQARQAPLTLAIVPSEKTIRPGSHVFVETTLTNNTDHVIWLHDRNRACDYPVEVRNQAGNLAPETPYKRQLRCIGPGPTEENRNLLVALNPHQAVNDEIDVSILFRLDKPGIYSIRAWRRIPKNLGEAPVSSNIITITVVD